MSHSQRAQWERMRSSNTIPITTTNSEAEYKAMITGMNTSREMGVKNLEVKSESQVVVGHVKGEYDARREKKEEIFGESERNHGMF
jgi:ribonuclease HI